MHMYVQFLGNNKLVISPTEKIITEPASGFDNAGFLDAKNTKTEFETSFNNARKLQQYKLIYISS